jgi:CheY-like chemotaxis protein
MKPTALIVEDDPTCQLLLERLVQRCDLLPIKAHNAAEGLYHYFKARPAVVLLDIMMPGVDGLSFLNVVNDLREKGIITGHADVIVQTAIGDAAKLSRLANGLAVHTVRRKPIMSEQILEDITAVLSSKNIDP